MQEESTETIPEPQTPPINYPQPTASENFRKFKWTLAFTILGILFSVFVSYYQTKAINPETLLIGLILSLMVALVTSRYEETKNNSEFVARTVVQLTDAEKSKLTDLNGICAELKNLSCPMQIEITDRPGSYDQANRTFEKFISKYQKENPSIRGSLLLMQRTPSPIFHTDKQKGMVGYNEEKAYIKHLHAAIDLAKKGKIKMIFAFSIDDPVFLKGIDRMYKEEPEASTRMMKWVSTFYDDKNPIAYWNFLRLFPMRGRSIQPAVVTSDELLFMMFWTEETQNERVYVKSLDPKKARQFFEMYWKLSDEIPPEKVRDSISKLGNK